MYITYIFLGEDPSEAKVACHLRFEQSIFP